MTLRQRILISVLPLVLLLLLQGVGGYLLLRNLGKRSDAILRENYDSIRAMVRMDAAAETVRDAVESRNHSLFDEGWRTLNEQLALEKENITVFPEEPILVEALERELRSFERESRLAVNATVEQREGTRNRFNSASATLKQRTAAIRDLNETAMITANQSAQRVARTSLIVFLVSFLFTLLLAVGLTFRLVSRLTTPIRSLTTAVEAVRSGDLTYRVPDGNRDELGMLASTFNDMAEQLWLIKQTNFRQLTRARETAQATIDSFPSPVVVVDREGRLELVNPAARRLFGVSGSESAHSSPWIPPESIREPVLAALREQRTYLTERFDQAIRVTLDGNERHYLPQVRPIRSSRGDTIGAAVTLDDVTPFRLLDQLKGDFVSTVSHELKTPLTGLRLVVHLLLEETVGPLTPKQIELLLDARDNAERLFQMIEQLLALARLEDRKDAIAIEKCHVADLFQRAVDTVSVRAADKQMTVAVNQLPDLPPVAADPIRLGHVLDNLMTNAVTYTPKGGTITLSAQATDRGVRLTIRDTGVGISAEDLPHLFEKFYRVSHEDNPTGTGLGLAIVREVVTAHGGTVECESTLGVGTSFHITLPVWPGAAP
ncbi:MAG: ATP-binding protein [Gemmataceae bacterium]